MNKFMLYAAVFALLNIAPSVSQVKPTLYLHCNSTDLNNWVDSVYNSMTSDERVGQLFMPIVSADANQRSRLDQLIKNQKVGGILFSKGTISSQADATNAAQQAARVPLLIAMDGEWGLNMRLTDAQRYPRNMVVGSIVDDSLVFMYGNETARQCREIGVHINFAPSMDVNNNARNPVIGTRSFGENPKNVARKGIAYARGLESGGVMSVAKHYPGHGDTDKDSHHVLPIINHDRQRLDSVELYPFREYINSGLSGIMTGHLDVPTLNTGGLPASLSPDICTTLLQDSMGFSGLIFTDGLAMNGVSTQPDMSVKALLAGNDILLGAVNQSKEFEAVKAAVASGVISDSLLAAKVKKVLTYKYVLGLHKPQQINTKGLKQKINTSRAAWLERRLYDEAIVLLKNDSLVPIKGLDSVRIASVALDTQSQPEFVRWMKRYANVRSYTVPRNGQLNNILNELKQYDLVIVSAHAPRSKESEALINLATRQNVMLVLFASSYELSNYEKTTQACSAVILAHDDSVAAQTSAAQIVFGGVAAKGRLPVSAGGFWYNDGLTTEKVRLSYNAPEEVGFASNSFDGIERIVNEGLRERAYPGCYVMVIKDNTVVYDRAFGNLDYKTPAVAVSDSTVYDLASITKALSTLPAIMKLYDNKQLRLQDRISSFVPELRGSNKENITVREALLHESGLVPFIPYYMSAIDQSSYVGKMFSSRQTATHSVQYAGTWARTDYKFKRGMIEQSADEKHPFQLAQGMYVGQQMRDTLLHDITNSNLRQRGRYAYSCLNFMLLKEAVENLSGTTIDDYVNTNFYKRIGATSTMFRPLQHLSAEIIAPTEDDRFFRRQTLRGTVHDEGAALMGGVSGNAGLFANANDLAKLSQMLLNGGIYGGERYISRETVTLFTSTKSSVSRRGLGFDKPDLVNTRLSPCSPLTPVSVYGHTGFTGTSFWIDPDNNLIYIFLSNRVHPSRTPNKLSTLNIRERIQDELYRIIKE